MTMRAHSKFIVLLLFRQIFGMQEFVSDDEESMFEGSGSGCYDVNSVPGVCDCTVIYDCLETCSPSQCEYTLGDCFTIFNGTEGCDDPHDSANVSQKSWPVVVSALVALVGLL